MEFLTPVSKDLLFSKNDPQDPRVGEFVNTGAKSCLSVIGYADDEGIANNGGRVGARMGPTEIRRALYKMTLPMLRPTSLQIQDVGNLESSGSLIKRHELAQQAVQELLKTSKVLALGGGHDYGFPDGAAFLETCQNAKEKPLIINFDAHLDVRPIKNEKITSGTPFWRLLENYKNFDLLEIGMQSQCNSSFHYEWALSKGARVLLYEELSMSGQNYTQKMLEFLEPSILKKRPTFLSVDMDVFSSAYAPGCSQVFGTGLTPRDFLPVLKVLLKRLDVRILGIYETSPALDVDQRTAKLAAQISHEYLFSF